MANELTWYIADRETCVLKTIIKHSKEEIGIWLLARMIDDHFGYEPAREVWERIKIYCSRGKELPSIEVFKDDTALSEEAKILLSGTLTPLETIEDATASWDILEDYRKRRGLYNILSDASANYAKPESEMDVAATINELETKLVSLHSQQSSFKILETGMEGNAKDLIHTILNSNPEVLVPTGIDKFDRLSGGWAKGDLVALVGPSGGGKSLLAQQILINQYEMGLNVCLVSFEMNEVEIYQRILANISDVEHSKIKRSVLTDQEKKKIQARWHMFDAKGEQKNCKMSIINPKQALTASQICNLLKPYNYDCVFIDYLSLVTHTTGNTEAERLGESAKTFKQGAVANNCVMVTLAQYNEEKKRIKYSTAIKDHVSFLWQWEYGEQQRELGQTDIIQNKTRNADRFNIPMFTEFKVSRWSSAPDTNNYGGNNNTTPANTNMFSVMDAPSMNNMEIAFDDDDL